MYIYLIKDWVRYTLYIFYINVIKRDQRRCNYGRAWYDKKTKRIYINLYLLYHNVNYGDIVIMYVYVHRPYFTPRRPNKHLVIGVIYCYYCCYKVINIRCALYISDRHDITALTHGRTHIPEFRNPLARVRPDNLLSLERGRRRDTLNRISLLPPKRKKKPPKMMPIANDDKNY